MKGPHRIERLQELFREEISRMLVEGRIKDPRVGFVTITKVEVTRDLSFATVYFSVMGPEEEKEETLQALEHASGYIQGQLGKGLRIRKIPRLRFKVDKNLEHSLRIGELLEKIRKGD
jgi:ribosome-binding factor A